MLKQIDIRNGQGWLIGVIHGPRPWAIEPYLAIAYNPACTDSKTLAFTSESDAESWIRSNPAQSA